MLFYCLVQVENSIGRTRHEIKLSFNYITALVTPTGILSVHVVVEGGGHNRTRLRLNVPWLDNCVRQDCDISHSFNQK